MSQNDRPCRKKKYPSRAAAKKAARRYLQSHGTVLTPYNDCAYGCGDGVWHLTSFSQSARDKLRNRRAAT